MAGIRRLSKVGTQAETDQELAELQENPIAGVGMYRLC